jgi:lactate dehydrogenase-like 2-hydroxyacid dehydrogenase
MQIFITDKKETFTKDQISQLESKGEVIFIESPDEWKSNEQIRSEEEKILALGPDVVEWELSNEEIDKIPNLKAISLPTTGFGWIDGEYLRSKDIILTNVPKYSTEAVAEHCILLMLALSKNLVMVINNNWKLDFDNHLGAEIKKKRMGIIGLGAIGSRVAELGKGMGMDISYWSRSSRNEDYTYLELDELLKTSDYIFLTLAANDGTENFLNKERLDLVKEGSYIINITGNQLWDFDYAVERVQDKSLGGIALEGEKEDIKNYGCNVLVTPGMGWYTQEALDEDTRIWVESVLSVTNGSQINVVN